MNDLIKLLRRRRDITQKELANAVGVRQSTISRMENDCSSSSWKLIMKILLFLQVDKKNVNKLINNSCSDKYYDFFYMMINDKSIRESIKKDPLFCINKFKRTLSYQNI